MASGPDESKRLKLKINQLSSLPTEASQYRNSVSLGHISSNSFINVGEDTPLHLTPIFTNIRIVDAEADRCGLFFQNIRVKDSSKIGYTTYNGCMQDLN